MRRELAAVYDELLRRQQAGEKSIYLTDEAVRILKEIAETAEPVDESATPEAVEPVAVKKKAVRKKTAPVVEVPAPPRVVLPEGTRQEQWDALREQVMSDPWCQSQVKPGKKVVLGVGSLEARIFFCGEAPGADEEIAGEPFVGPAGQLLTKIIQAMGLQRGDVYIGNIMNYRPPMPTPVGNRAPELNEMAYCLPYLRAQLDIVQPELVVALGNTAVEGLLGHDPKRRIGQIRGGWMEYNGIPLIPTFHPSYLLRNQSMATKRLVWEDMLKVMDRLKMPVSDKQRGFFK
ncbi:MAG: uracil-DNA glycosylase [Opitutales bacterium]|jgi:uracil-DNA glycosylase family 4